MRAQRLSNDGLTPPPGTFRLLPRTGALNCSNDRLAATPGRRYAWKATTTISAILAWPFSASRCATPAAKSQGIGSLLELGAAFFHPANA